MFESAGEKPRWLLVYEGIRTLEVGETASYGDLSRWAQVDVSSSANRGCVYDAIEVLQRDDRRTLVNVRSVGYRVAEANEHEIQARRHRLKAYRQAGKARRKAASADRNRLTGTEAARLDRLEVGYSKVEQLLRGFERRELRTELALKEAQQVSMAVREETKALRRETQGDIAELSSKVETVEDRIARLERLALRAVS